MKKIPRILLMCDAASIHSEKWCRSLSESGMTVGICTLHPPLRDWHAAIDQISLFDLSDAISDNDSKRLGVFSLLNSIRRIKYLALLPRIKKVIRAFRPDIIHAHYASSYGLLSLLTGFRPVLVSVWGTDIFRFPRLSPIHNLAMRYVLDRAALVFSTSKAMRKEARAYTGRPIVVTPFGVDTETYRPFHRPFSKKVTTIGTIKGLREFYRIDLLLKAVADLSREIPAREDLRVLLVGDGPERGNLEGLATSLGIRNKIDFYGHAD